MWKWIKQPSDWRIIKLQMEALGAIENMYALVLFILDMRTLRDSMLNGTEIF